MLRERIEGTAIDIVVPAFFDAQHVADFDRLPGSSPGAPLVVFDVELWIAPITDPGVIAFWTTQIQACQAAGVRVLGYVPTDDGKSANGYPTLDGSQKHPYGQQARILQNVDRWYTTFAPVTPDGIFFDEGPARWTFTGCAPGMDTSPPTLCADVKNFYASIYNYVKSSQPAGKALVMLNAAYYDETDDWIMTRPAADIALLWEAPASNYLITGSAPNYPAQPPSWWTNPLYSPARVAHTVYGCPRADLCQVVALARQRGTGFVYAFDGGSASYNMLPQYWADEIEAVVLRDDNDVYVRDWTDTTSSYDQGQEPSTHFWWVSSDVWNRRSAVLPPGGFFNAADQPESENPIRDQFGNNTNFAFARIHRKACGQQLDVDARFLWADFGMGGNYQDVSVTPTTGVTFNAGDSVRVTSGVQWSIPATASPHVCLAVEVTPVPSALDPLKNGSLSGRSSSVSGGLIPPDNNKAQRNLDVVRVLAPLPFPLPYFAVVHNGELIRRDMIIKVEGLNEGTSIVLDAEVVVIDDGEQVKCHPLRSSRFVSLAEIHPTENRWLGIRFDLKEAPVGTVVPVAFLELDAGRVVNGYTILFEVCDMPALVASNLRAEAWQVGRMETGFGMVAPNEIKSVYLGRHEVSSLEAYRDHLRHRTEWLRERVLELVEANDSSDPFGSVYALTRLLETLASGNDPEVVSAHTRALQAVDPLLTMLQKQRGDVADILQTVRWQERVFSTLAPFNEAEAAGVVVRASKLFAERYGRGETEHERYSRLMAELLDSIRESLASSEGAGQLLRREYGEIEANLDAPARLQRAHRNLLIRVEELQAGAPPHGPRTSGRRRQDANGSQGKRIRGSREEAG